MSFVNIFKINVLKVIIYRKASVSRVNVSKGNELKGKVPKKTNFLKTMGKTILNNLDKFQEIKRLVFAQIMKSGPSY